VASDVELINRIRDGDAAALEALYNRYLATVWRFACTRTYGHDAAAWDLVSETFLAAIRDLARYDPNRGAVAAWLIGIARHKAANLHRRHTEEGPVIEPSTELDPSQPASQQESRQEIVAVLAAMDEDQRLALEWKYVEGLSVREIAARLNRSEKAAEALLFRAREDFRRRYKPILEKQEL